MTESRDRVRDGEPDTPDMIDGAHDYATWDARQATWDNSVMPSKSAARQAGRARLGAAERLGPSSLVTGAEGLAVPDVHRL